MLLSLLAGLAALGATPVLAVDLGGPLAPAALGKIQCFSPDVIKKTCQAISAYKSDKDGLSEVATILVAKDPVVTMTTTAPVRVQDGRVCGPVRPEDVAAASFMIDGKPASPDQARELGGQLGVAMKDIFGHEICVAFTAAGEGFLASSTMDGAPQPGPGQPLIWVPSTDGYRVAP